MKTRRINIFNQEPRKIRCVKNTFDYLGDSNITTEKELEVGKLYTLVKAEMQSYGAMVFVEGIEKKYGFQDYLFEELEEYDEALYEERYTHWLEGILAQGMKDIEEGNTIDVTKNGLCDVLERHKSGQ